MDRGKWAITVDEIPLEWCFQPEVKLGSRHLPDWRVGAPAAIEAAAREAASSAPADGSHGSSLVARQNSQVFVIRIDASAPLGRDLAQHAETFQQFDRLAHWRRRQAQ